MSFCEENQCISDAQFGFKKGSSTIDAIFALHTLIEHYLNHNSRFYVAFIDIKKCFDSIYRNALWLKLYRSGLQGKLLRIIKDMYNEVKSCVKHCTSFSDYFNYSIGLRQGEIMSPILVSLFLEDLELFLQNKFDSGLIVDDIVLILLLFADDMAIFGKTVQELQLNLDTLHMYCNKWGLEVNASKTKIMVFRKRGNLKRNDAWTYNGVNVDVVDCFNYLGTIFSYNGNFSLYNEYLTGKALKAMNVLISNCRNFPLKLSTLCQLFDSFVGTMLNYGCEITGFKKSKDIERIHLKFCKNILRVPWNACNAAVYGELGRYPMYISRYCKIVKYWCKITHSENIILNRLYNLAVRDSISGCTNWVSRVKRLLDDFGFSDMYNSVNSSDIHIKSFPLVFKNRLIDCYKQEWFSLVERNSLLQEYKHFKSQFSYEQYLDLVPFDLRFLITKLRISSHKLRVHSGRFGENRLPRNERLCLYCNLNDIEDITLFVFVHVITIYG